MVRRDQWGAYWGAKKIIFLIRDIDDATRAGASMETCQFVVLRSLGGRLWSVLDVRKRRRRMRWRLHRCIHIKQLSQPGIGPEAKSPKFWIQSSLESPKHRRMWRRGLPDVRPTPEGVREPICIHKK